ncbi:hypothetical protein [Nonomuraea sp. NPDC050643]|uniref:cupin domain-containing protein n=1 Tax=Nonomuraea sp. NPDC050643 TaxID=3155660 RepID=UPI0033EE96ED
MVSATYDGFPAAVGVSRLRVYDWPTVDGRPGGGTPHLHLTCSEGYMVTAGRGTVQTLTASGHQETPLEPGVVAWFTPGTIHRLTSDGDLATHRFLELREATESGDPEPLAAFHRAAAELVRSRLDAWERRWRDGAHAAATATQAQFGALRDREERYLAEARVAATGPGARGRSGMCGRLDVYPDL